MPHVTNPREASEFSRPNVRLGKYRILSALSETNFLFCKNLSGRASESANTGSVPSEISESGIMVLYRGILLFLIISFYPTCGSCHITTRRSRTLAVDKDVRLLPPLIYEIVSDNARRVKEIRRRGFAPEAATGASE